MNGMSTALGASIEELPFTVRVAGSANDFAALCAFRAGAYARHNYTSTLAARLSELDDYDRRAFLMTAVDKSSGRCIGTMRISLTSRGDAPVAPYEPLGIVHGQHFAYVDRFAVEVSDNHVTVRQALMKAMWLLVCDQGPAWVVASAMAPLARLYRGVGLHPIPEAEKGFPHPKLHDTALYYMCGSRTVELFRNLSRASAARAHWFARVNHPDIEVPWPPDPRWLRIDPARVAAEPQPEPALAAV